MLHEVEMINAWLGGKPFVLVELDGESTGDGEDDFNVVFRMRFGGGISKSGAFGTMATLLEEHGWDTKPPEGFDPDADD